MRSLLKGALPNQVQPINSWKCVSLTLFFPTWGTQESKDMLAATFEQASSSHATQLQSPLRFGMSSTTAGVLTPKSAPWIYITTWLLVPGGDVDSKAPTFVLALSSRGLGVPNSQF